MSASTRKSFKKELLQLHIDTRAAVNFERERCAGIAQAYQKRALEDGMVVHAQVAVEIASGIRGADAAMAGA